MFESLLFLVSAEQGLPVPAWRAYALWKDPLHACDNSTTIAYIRNDLAYEMAWMRNDSRNDTMHYDHNYLHPFMSQAADADVLVLNRGLHVVEDRLLEHQVSRLAHELRGLLDERPSVQIYWRTSVAGHQNCTHASKLLEDAYTPSMGHRYHWDMVGPQNELVRTTLDAVVHVEYIDASTLSNRRADRHAGYRKRLHGAPVLDCLHYCAPGPVDDWNALLATLLLHRRGALS